MSTEDLPPSVAQALKASPGCAISVSESISVRATPGGAAPATTSTTREYFLLCPHKEAQLLERSTSQRELQAGEAVPGLGPLSGWLGRGGGGGGGGGGGWPLEALLPPWAQQQHPHGSFDSLPPWAQAPQPPWAQAPQPPQQPQAPPRPAQQPRRPPAPGSIQV